jgi:hypothetical protein
VPFRCPAILAIAAALATAPVATAQKPTPPAGFDQQLLYHTQKIPPLGQDQFFVTCPAGWAAIGAGLERKDADIVEQVPVKFNGSTQAEFQYSNEHSSEDRLVTVWVACIRSKRSPKITPLVIKGAVLPGAAEAIDAECRRRTRALLGDHFIDIQPGQGRQRAGFGAIVGSGTAHVASMRTTARGVRGTIVGGATGGAYQVRAYCVAETVRLRGGGKGRVVLDRERAKAMAPPGESVLRADCGDGRIPLGPPGFAAPGTLFVLPAPGLDGGGQLRVSNPGGAPQAVTIELNCTRGELARTRVTGVTVDTTTGPLVIGPAAGLN